jgi:hypothetical protein
MRDRLQIQGYAPEDLGHPERNVTEATPHL